ncbi:MAG: hypothetical protein U1C46_04670 [Bacteroidales bacterium]|nr:hypothetical protein [Bacteroidales bacterium]
MLLSNFVNIGHFTTPLALLPARPVGACKAGGPESLVAVERERERVEPSLPKNFIHIRTSAKTGIFPFTIPNISFGWARTNSTVAGHPGHHWCWGWYVQPDDFFRSAVTQVIQSNKT